MRLRVSASLLTLSFVCLTSASTCDDGPTEPAMYFLTLSTAGSGSGTIAASPAGNADGAYVDGTTVSITATAQAGSDFTGWNEGDTHGCTEPKNPCTVTMDQRRSVVATFAPSSGTARFDGLYTGTYNIPGQSSPQTVNLTVVNGVVTAKTVPLYGSQTTFTGTVSATGAFSALIESQSGPSFTCQTRLSGTITTSLVDGIMTATLSGTYQAESVPGKVGCGAGNPLPSGSWSATRDRIRVEKIA